MKILLATGNRGKLEEFRKLLDIPGLTLIGLKDIEGDFTDCIEDGDTFQENADKKALHWLNWQKCNVLADDSGLEVEALNGEPGVRSARFAGEHSSDILNNELLLEKMRGEENRSARFVCCLSLCFPGGEIHHFKGTVEGKITDQPRGNNGFGYDPLFFHEDSGRTFAEISVESKNSISHRARAVGKLREFLLTGEVNI